MISRYVYPEMEQIWTDENKFKIMLQIEIFACEIMAKLGYIPINAFKIIKEKADFSIVRIREIENEIHHDILAFLQAIGENVGEESKYIHMGLTSSDVKDTALGKMMQQASDIILDDLEELKKILTEKVIEHKYTIMIGRTHGIHAEPITLGLKFAVWVDEIERNISRVKKAREIIAVGKLSGAVGTYAEIDPEIEKYTCEKMGLKTANLTTQIIQRDRHAELMTTLAIVGSSLDKFATELRNLQRTEIREVEEYFRPGQKGSSAMPHKRNPITCEKISGLARILRGNALAALENIVLWHERDITHSSVERIIVPDSFCLLDYMLRKFIDTINLLLVYPDTMKKNINKTGGLIFSQRVLLALVYKGVQRELAYKWVQRNALANWAKGTDFRTNISCDVDIINYLTQKEIDECFNNKYQLKHIDAILDRLNL